MVSTIPAKEKKRGDITLSTESVKDENHNVMTTGFLQIGQHAQLACRSAYTVYTVRLI